MRLAYEDRSIEVTVSSAAFSISGVNRSVSKLLTFPCTTAATRSSPIPVSIDGFGSGASLVGHRRSSRTCVRGARGTIELHEN